LRSCKLSTDIPALNGSIKGRYGITRKPGGNAWEAVKAPIVAKGFLERQIEELRAAASTGYSRGRYEVPRDREDWHD
jgi:hypothetical protein